MVVGKKTGVPSDHRSPVLGPRRDPQFWGGPAVFYPARHDPRAYSLQYRRGSPLQLHPVRNRSSGVAGERRSFTQFSPHKIQSGEFARPPRTNDDRPEGNCTILSLTRRERSAWGDVPMGGMYGRGIQAGVWIRSVMRTRVPKALGWTVVRSSRVMVLSNPLFQRSTHSALRATSGVVKALGSTCLRRL